MSFIFQICVARPFMRCTEECLPIFWVSEASSDLAALCYAPVASPHILVLGVLVLRTPQGSPMLRVPKAGDDFAPVDFTLSIFHICQQIFFTFWEWSRTGGQGWCTKDVWQLE